MPAKVSVPGYPKIEKWITEHMPKEFDGWKIVFECMQASDTHATFFARVGEWSFPPRVVLHPPASSARKVDLLQREGAES
jgi:hypothetical protein